MPVYFLLEDCGFRSVLMKTSVNTGTSLRFLRGQLSFVRSARGLTMLNIRPATKDDGHLLKTLIHELAEYEHLEHESIVTEADVLRDGFGKRPKFRALIAEWDGHVSGYALFFEFYSSFQGRAGLFLEDIFVRPAFRKKVSARSCWPRLPKSPGKKSIFACGGKSSTGTNRRSISTRNSAPNFSMSGDRCV